MSLDKSLKSGASLVRHRNVLKRGERIEVLKQEDRWEDGQSPIGLPKVAHRKAKVGKKGKEARSAESAQPSTEAASPEATEGKS